MLAEITNREIELTLYLFVSRAGQTNPARLANALQTRSDVDAVAQQIATTFNHYIAKIDPDAKLDTFLLHEIGVADAHAALHLDSATQGIHRASELNENAVSSRVYDTPAMPLDRWIDQIGSQFAQSLERPFLVRADKPAITGHVGGQDSRQPAQRVVGRHQPLHPAWIGEASAKLPRAWRERHDHALVS